MLLKNVVPKNFSQNSETSMTEFTTFFHFLLNLIHLAILKTYLVMAKIINIKKRDQLFLKKLFRRNRNIKHNKSEFLPFYYLF